MEELPMFRLAKVVFACSLALLVAPRAMADDLKLTVVFASPTLPGDAASIVQAAGGQVVAAVPQIGMVQVTGPLSALDALMANGLIRAVSPSVEFQLPTPPAEPFAEAQPANGSVVPDL